MVGTLAIYPMIVSPGGTTDPNDPTNPHGAITDFDVGVSANEDGVASLLDYFAGPIMAGIMGGVFTAMIISYFAKVPSVAAVGYSIFAGAFFTFFTSSFDIFFKMVGAWHLDSGTNMGISAIIWVFGIIVFIIFVAGFAQMLSGGWKAIE